MLEYIPSDFSPWLYKTRGWLEEMSERDRYLSNQYVEIMKSPSVLFLHQNNSSVQELTQLRRSFFRASLGFQFVNTKLFKGQLLDTKYSQLIPLLSGPTCITWPLLQFPHSSDGKLDTVLFTSQILNVLGANKKVILMGGKMESHLVSAQEVRIFAQLQSADRLRSLLLTTMSSLPSQLVSTLAYPMHELTRSISLVPPQ